LSVGEDLVVQRKQVFIGHRQPGMVEITQGLLPGERVIIRGTTRVGPGQSVTINRDPVAVPPKG
jgi:membrane fusion protein (multidrug efflux system)